MYLLILAILFVLALVWALRRPKRVSALTPALIGLALAAGITSLTAQSPTDSQIILVTWAIVIVFYAIFTELDRPELGTILYVFLVALAAFASLVSIWLAARALAGGQPIDYVQVRATGLVAHANVLAVIMIGTMALGVQRLLDGQGRRGWTIAGLVIAYLALALTVSRGAWIGWLIGLVVLAALIAPVRRWLLTPRWLAMCVVVLALTNPQGVRILLRLANTSGEVGAAVAAETTSSGRMPVWLGAIGFFRQHPLVGIGPWNFGPIYNEGAPPNAFYWAHAHNVVLTFAAEEGLAGLLALAALVGIVGWSMWRGLHDDQRRTGAALAAALAAALLVDAMFDYAYRGPGTILLLLLIWNRLLPENVSARWRPWVTWATVATVGLMGVVEWIIIR